MGKVLTIIQMVIHIPGCFREVWRMVLGVSMIRMDRLSFLECLTRADLVIIKLNVLHVLDLLGNV